MGGFKMNFLVKPVASTGPSAACGCQGAFCQINVCASQSKPCASKCVSKALCPRAIEGT